MSLLWASSWTGTHLKNLAHVSLKWMQRAKRITKEVLSTAIKSYNQLCIKRVRLSIPSSTISQVALKTQCNNSQSRRSISRIIAKIKTSYLCQYQDWIKEMEEWRTLKTKIDIVCSKICKYKIHMNSKNPKILLIKPTIMTKTKSGKVLRKSIWEMIILARVAFNRMTQSWWITRLVKVLRADLRERWWRTDAERKISSYLDVSMNLSECQRV